MTGNDWLADVAGVHTFKYLVHSFVERVKITESADRGCP